jgi:prepilin-type processing-associated H-X9-DG protein
MTYPFPPSAPWISVSGFLLLVLIGIFALSAAFLPWQTLFQFRTVGFRRHWLVALAIVAVAATVASVSISIRELLASVLVFVDAIVVTLAVTRVCLLPFRRRLTLGSGCAGLALAFVLAFIFVFLPAVKSARDSATRTTFRSKLKLVAIAMHNNADVHDGAFPDAVSADSGEPGQTWRISLLPQLDRRDLQSTYSVAQAWDADANQQIARTELRYLSCEKNPFPADEAGRYYTDLAVVTGPKTAFPGGKGMTLDAFTDGTSHTIVIGECSGLNVVWTEPRDIDVSKQKIGINLPGDRPRFSSSILSSYHPGGAHVIFVDGSVRFLSEKIDPKVLQALTTATGGESVPDDGRW